MPRKGQQTIKGVRTPARKLNRKSTAALVQTRQKEEQAIKLRMAGMSLAAIAKQLGYASASGASQAIQRAVDRIGIEPAMELVKLELHRLDEMQKVCWTALIRDGDTSQVNPILRIMEMRARFTGLDHFVEKNRDGAVINIQGGQVNVGTGAGGVLIIQGDESEYVKALAAATGVDPKELEAGTWLDDNIVDAEVVEDVG